MEKLNPGDVVTWYVDAPGVEPYVELAVSQDGQELCFAFDPTPWSQMTVLRHQGLTAGEAEAVINRRWEWDGPGLFWKSFDEHRAESLPMPDTVQEEIDARRRSMPRVAYVAQ